MSLFSSMIYAEVDFVYNTREGPQLMLLLPGVSVPFAEEIQDFPEEESLACRAYAFQFMLECIS